MAGWAGWLGWLAGMAGWAGCAGCTHTFQHTWGVGSDPNAVRVWPHCGGSHLGKIVLCPHMVRAEIPSHASLAHVNTSTVHVHAQHLLWHTRALELLVQVLGLKPSQASLLLSSPSSAPMVLLRAPQGHKGRAHAAYTHICIYTYVRVVADIILHIYIYIYIHVHMCVHMGASPNVRPRGIPFTHTASPHQVDNFHA
jgi:hypothetical protein